MPAGLNKLPELVITVVVVSGVLYAGIATMSGMPDSGEEKTGVEAVELDGTNWVGVGVDHIKTRTVYNSLGYAISLDGSADSYWQSSEPIEWSNDSTWAVSTWAADENASTNTAMTALSLDGRVVVLFNESASQWRTWYYDEGTRDSYSLSAPATGNESNLTHVSVVRNGSTLTMYVNGTQGESVDLTTDTSTPAPNASNWEGRIDEVRTFDTVLNSSQRQQLRDAPVAPLTTSERTARIMFDEPDESTQLLFYAPGGIQTSQAGYARGHPGEKMEGATLANQISGSTDYRWDWDRLEMRAVDGGQLEHAPAAYLDYQKKTLQGILAGGFREFVGLMGTLFVVMVLVTVVLLLQRL